jgi:pimeloyl-ACP methyl ester carboxylesterase
MMTKTIGASLAALALLGSGPTVRADEPANPLDQAPSRFTKVGDIRVHYKSLGKGETALVFIHGWTCDLTFWRSQVPAFDGKIRMVLIDLPGHGQSDKLKVEYTMELFARSIDAVLKDAGVEGAVLAGHSMGTPVIRQFYRLYAKKTRGLIAVDGGLRRPSFTPAQLEQMIGRFSGLDYKDNIAKMVDGMFTPQTPAEVRKSVKAVMVSAPQHVAMGAMKGMWDPAVWKDDDITVPLQVIVAKSPFWSADYQAYVRKHAPQVDYRVMDGVGHFLMLEKPAAFNDILGEFLKKQGFFKP